jgi:hypothetical protein
LLAGIVLNGGDDIVSRVLFQLIRALTRAYTALRPDMCTTHSIPCRLAFSLTPICGRALTTPPTRPPSVSPIVMETGWSNHLGGGPS